MSFRIGRFKSADARGRYLTQYEELRALSPQPDVVHDVPTEFGTVRVYQHGPDRWRVGRSDPRLLPHVGDVVGAGRGLGRRFHRLRRGCAGPARGKRSVEGRCSRRRTPRVASTRYWRRWSCTVSIWLGIPTAAGLPPTHGSQAPQRFASVTLVDPANTVVRLSTRFWVSAALQGRPGSARARRAATWITGHHALAVLFGAGFAAFEPPLRTPPMRLISDHVLRSVDVPVQVLLAGNTVHDSGKGIARMRSVVPDWRHHLWPNASHALPVELPDEVNDSIRRFVTEHRSRQ